MNNSPMTNHTCEINEIKHDVIYSNQHIWHYEMTCQTQVEGAVEMTRSLPDIAQMAPAPSSHLSSVWTSGSPGPANNKSDVKNE